MGAKYPRRGSAAIEYAVMVGLVAVVVVATVQDLGTQVESILKKAASEIASAKDPVGSVGGAVRPIDSGGQSPFSNSPVPPPNASRPATE